MFSSGVVTKADILRSELDVAKAELGLTKTRSSVDLAKNSFNLIIGGKLDDPVNLDEEDFKIGGITAPDYNEFLAIAYSERPEWRIVSYGKDIADKQSLASYSGYIPSFLLSGSYGYNDVNDTVMKTDNNLKSWNMALVGSWTLFDGLATPNKVKEAYAKYVEAAKNKELLEKNIAIDVKNACSNLNSAVDEMKLARKALELADENYKIAELRYSSGVGTNVEVMDAKTLYTSAKLDLLQAEFDYELAKAAVNKAVGKEVFIEKQQQKELGEPEIVLHGTAAYVPIEGGFAGFLDKEGNRYDLSGIKVAEISSAIGTTETGRKVKITGKVKKGIVTIHMWGTPFEVTSYEWE
jgi:outer membrane protein TolC